MHMQSLKFLLPKVRRKCIYKKYIITGNVAQYPLHYVTNAPAKFEVATPNSLGGDTFTRNITDTHMQARTHARTDRRRTYFGTKLNTLKKKAGITMILFFCDRLSAQFIKIISHYKKIGFNINVLQQTACLVVNPITVGNFAFLFNCTPVGRTSDSMMVPT